MKKEENKNIIGKCVYCKKDITEIKLQAGKAIRIGQNKYRCTRCAGKAIDSLMKKYKKEVNK